MAVTGDDEVTREPARRAVRQMEDRIRELKRQLGRKTLEVEIFKGPQGPWPQWGRESPKDMEKSRAKKPTLLAQSQLKDGSR